MVKLKIYLTPNPNLKCIMNLPHSPNPTPPPNMMRPALHNKRTTTKPSYPQAHEITAGNTKMPGANASNKHYDGYAKVTICSLTTASPTPRTNALQSSRTTPTMQSLWQLIVPMHNMTNKPSGLPHEANIYLEADVRRIKRKI
jgi:hypothetical protein